MSILPKALWERLETKEVKRSLWLVIGIGFTVNLLLLTSPLYMLQLYDRVLTSRSAETLLSLSVIAFFLLVSYGVLEVMRSKVMIGISIQFDRNLNQQLFDNVFNEAVLRHNVGSQAIRDLEMVRNVISGHALLVLLDLPWSPLFIALIFIMHPLLGTVALLGVCASVILAVISERLSRPMVQETTQQQIRASRFVDSCLRNVDAIHSMGMRSQIRERWLANYAESVNIGANTAGQVSSFSGTSKAMRIILQSSILGTGAWLVLQDEVTSGVMVAASIIFGRAIGPIEQSIAASKSLLAARQASQRINRLMERYDDTALPMQLPVPTGNLQVENLTLIPPGGQKAILQSVSFTLAQGEVLAIVGASASGKSSLARSVVGLWQPARGKVKLDNAELSQWNPEALGQYVGFLPQDVELLTGTIKDNIARFGKDDADAVLEAARRAGCHEMILGLEDGYDTFVDENQCSLSAGQCQRIALARCFYKNPCLVVLDEPDSNLDVDGVVALDQAVKDMKIKKMTTIIITHNIRLLQHADKAMLLANGGVAYFGTPRDLVEKLNQRVGS